jgi:hypothetical protein
MSRHRCQKCNGPTWKIASYNSKTGARGLFWECRDCKHCEDVPKRVRKPKPDAVDALIAKIEAEGLGWSLDHTGCLIEARVWKWPSVVGRYRPAGVEPLAVMLQKAYENYQQIP